MKKFRRGDMKDSQSVYGSSDTIKSHINQMSHFTFLKTTGRNSAGIEGGAQFPLFLLFSEWPYREQRAWIIGMPSVEELAKTVPSHLGAIYPIR